MWLVRTRTDIKLRPSRLEYYHNYNQYINTTGKNKNWYQVVVKTEVDRVFPMLYVARYNKLVQLITHAIVIKLLLSNCHLAAFLEF